MNKKTKSILDEYNDEITELDVSNKNIKGILNLSKFKKLYKLNCSNNNITKIIVIKNLTDINCSHNKIVKVSDKLFFSSQNNILTNPIEEIEYPFDINMGLFGNTVKKIIFNYSFNDQVDNLPNELKILVFSNKFNKTVDNLPNCLKEIYFGYDFNQFVDNLPASLELIVFGLLFDNTIDNLPSGIKEIKFNDLYLYHDGEESKFNKNINSLPYNLEKIILPNNFNSTILNFPPNLKYLDFGKSYNQPINNLSNSLKVLIFNEKFNNFINNLPPELIHLTIKNKSFDINNIKTFFPDSLTNLYISSNIFELINLENIQNVKNIKIYNFNDTIYNNHKFTKHKILDKLKNSYFTDIVLDYNNFSTPNLNYILQDMPDSIQSLKIIYDKHNYRIKTSNIPYGLKKFEINGIIYNQNKLKKIKQEKFYKFN